MARLEKSGKDKIESKKNYNNRIEQEKIDQLRSMKLHGQFGRDADEKIIALDQKWKFESLLSAAQEQALNTKLD